jgi:hypothetical protein
VSAPYSARVGRLSQERRPRAYTHSPEGAAFTADLNQEVRAAWGREREFAEVRSCRSGRLGGERQVTGALPPEAGHRAKVGSGRQPDAFDLPHD